MDHVEKTLGDVQAQIADMMAQVSRKKIMANQLAEMLGRPVLYHDTEEALSSGPGPLRSDEFYGMALTTAVKLILERRKAANLGAATVAEIYESMKAGGFHFETKNDENAKRGLYGSLSKNTATFHRLPSGAYGLRAWYQQIKEPRKKGGVTVDNSEAAPVDSEDSLDDLIGEAAEYAEPVGSGDAASLPKKPR